jgi:tetrapyrrole methylase family protein/MazG family protein
MIDLLGKSAYNVQDLVEIVRILRAPGGCQWDQEQTHQSIRRNFLEEAYEVAEAIDEDSTEHLKEELGDVLLQVVFHTSIEEDAEHFDLDEVADGVCRKLIYRHPHVFGDVTVHSTGEILANWEELKKKEKGQATQADAVDAVARSLPALWRAEKVQKKAAKVGFDWADVSGAMEKLTEETAELNAAIGGDGDVTEELGDLLFAAVNAARFLKVDPEDALQKATDKFAARFRRVEETVTAQGKRMEDMTLAELDAIWEQIKHDPS